MSEYVLETNQLSKTYGNRKAVNKVDMHVKAGEIYGFIGRNGAGKTTFLKMVANLISPNSGNISLFGQTKLTGAHKKVGILIENPGLHLNMTATENLKMKCMLLGIKDSKRKIKELLEFVGLEKATKQTRAFSLGMKQRLGIAMALVNDPELLLLDEPINGLDPQGIVEIREMLLELQKQGKTIIISSHILEELGKICNRYGVIASGQLVRELTQDEVEKIAKKSIHVKVDDVVKAKEVLLSSNITNYEVSEEGIQIFAEDIDVAELNKKLVSSNIAVSELHKQTESVEDLFISMMGGSDYA